MFGLGHISSSLFCTEQLVVCPVPSLRERGIVPISLSLNAVDFHATRFNFTFVYVDCKAGNFSERGDGDCKPCPAGTYSDEDGARRCKECSSSSYANGTGNTHCTPCPPFTIAVGNPVSLASCVCNGGYYNPMGQPGQPCLPCPENGVCSGGTSLAVARAGFWASHAQPFDFIRCESPEACPGGEAETCGDEYSGRLCSACVKGWYRSTSGCFPCLRYSWGIAAGIVGGFVVLVGLVVGSCLLLGKSVRDTITGHLSRIAGFVGELVGVIVIVLKFLQFGPLLGKLEVSWPYSVSRGMSGAGQLTPKISSLGIGCLFPLSFEAKWRATLLIPFAIAIPFVAIWILLWARSRFSASAVPQKTAYIKYYIKCSTPFHLTFAMAALEPFACRKEPGGSWTLVADPSLECFQPWWHAILPLAIAGAILYIVGIPLAIWWRLARNSKQLAEPGFSERYGGLYEHYQPEHAYWEALMMLENILIAGAGLFLSSYVVFQVVVLQIIVFGSLLITQHYLPFQKDEDNALHSRLRYCIMGTLSAALLFRAGDFPARWARRMVTFSTLCLLAIGVAVILYMTFLRTQALWKTHKVRIPPGLEKKMGVLCPKGQVLVTLWLRNHPTLIGLASVVVSELAEVCAPYAHARAGTTTGNPESLLADDAPISDSDIVADAVVGTFCGGTLRYAAY